MLRSSELAILDVAAPFEVMKFTLTFDGELKANAGPDEKWAIRNHLHPQLEELWQTNRALRNVAQFSHVRRGGEAMFVLEPYIDPVHPPRDWSTPVPVETDYEDLAAPIARGPSCLCVPLVRKSLDLACTLDILFLRKGEKGDLFPRDGDIDNRLKTFFDGLRMPKYPDDFGCNPVHPSPILCLLEEDALITGFTVDTDRLLTRPKSRDSEVRIIVQANIHVLRVRSWNQAFLGS